MVIIRLKVFRLKVFMVKAEVLSLLSLKRMSVHGALRVHSEDRNQRTEARIVSSRG